MRAKLQKAIVACLVIALFVFCATQVIAEGSKETKTEENAKIVTVGGKVPVGYLAEDAYSDKRLAEGKAMFEEKCAICHSQSGRDMVYFGDPDFNEARVAGSVKKFAGATADAEIGEKVYEYLRYNNDGPFMSQDDPFLQPGPYGTGVDHKNPVLSEDRDFWGSITGHKIPTPDDVNIEKMWDSYDMKYITLPYPIANWSEFMPHEVPLAKAVKEINNLFKSQRYNLNSLPLSNKGMGLMFNYMTNSVYTKYQFSSHDYARADHSKDALEAVYSTSLLCMLGVMDFEYGLPQRVNGEWSGPWEWGPYENQILWGPGSNLDNINTYGINAYENIYSREAYRNKWTQYSTMFVTGKNGVFTPNSYYWYATMPWGCKTYDSGLFGGPDIQQFTGFKGFTEMWKHSQTYTDKKYNGTQSIADYGAAVRKYLIDMYWQFEGLPYYSHDKKTAINPFLEVIYRQWTAAIGVTDDQLRTLISDSYNLPDGDRDMQRYNTLVQSYENLSSAMTEQQKAFVKAYIRRLYPTNPTGYKNRFTPYKWNLVEDAPKTPVMLPFGSDTAVAGEEYSLRILRAQSADGDIKITASNLPKGAELVCKKGNWISNDNDYVIKWTPTKADAGKTYTVTLTATSNMGTSTLKTDIKVLDKAQPVEMDDIGSYTVYSGQDLCFPLTVKNYKAENLSFSMEGSFGSVINNAWNTAGLYTLEAQEADVGEHTVKFTVKDAQGNTSTKSAKITVLKNSAPTVTMTPNGAGPGSNKNIYYVKAGETLRLMFNVKDADGDRVEISKNAEFPGTINGNIYTYKVTDEMAKNFPGPNVLVFYFKDMASTGSRYSLPEYKGGETKKVLLVYFEPKSADDNHSPWSMPGNAQTVTAGDIVTLNGSASDDSDKDTITFKWTQESGTAVTLSDAAGAKPTFTAPNVSKPTVLKFYLTVTDPGGLSDVGVTRVLVNPKSK